MRGHYWSYTECRWVVCPAPDTHLPEGDDLARPVPARAETGEEPAGRVAVPQQAVPQQAVPQQVQPAASGTPAERTAGG